MTMKAPIPFFVGTYTEALEHVDGRGPGIIPCSLNPESGEMSISGPAVSIRNPAYLWIKDDLLYSTSEIVEHLGYPDGSITTFRISSDRRSLKPLETISSSGRGPAWIKGDRSGNWLLVANYVEGSIGAFPIESTGLPVSAARMHHHSGNGPHPERQKAPHPHAILSSTCNRHIYVADLGTDSIHGYDFNPVSGKLHNSDSSCFNFPPGSGPRHLLFHPHHPWLLVSLELSSQVACLAHDPSDGSLSLLDLQDTIPGIGRGANHPSELITSSCGRHLYVANRGHDSITCFTIDPSSGALERTGIVSCGGRTPRLIALSPDEKWLLVANQESDRLNILHRSASTGQLRAHPESLELPTPCFIAF